MKKLLMILCVLLVFSMFGGTGYASYSTLQEEILYGDVNDDGQVTNVDLILIKRYIAGISLENFSLEAADVDGSKSVTNIDIIILNRFLTGMIDRLGPVEQPIDEDKIIEEIDEVMNLLFSLDINDEEDFQVMNELLAVDFIFSITVMDDDKEVYNKDEYLDLMLEPLDYEVTFIDFSIYDIDYEIDSSEAVTVSFYATYSFMFDDDDDFILQVDEFHRLTFCKIDGAWYLELYDIVVNDIVLL